MVSNVEDLGDCRVKINISFTSKEFDEELERTYNKYKDKYNIPGFRKGKVPRKFVEMKLGKSVFFEETINNIVPPVVSDAIDKNNILVASVPEYDIKTSSAEEGLELDVTLIVMPVIPADLYTGIEVPDPSTSATEDEVIAEIEKDMDKNSRIITVDDRSAIKGDIVNIDFTGFAYNEEFEGGKGEGIDLELGSNTFVGNFEDQIIGKNTGDEFEVYIRFPETYHDERLKGAPARFDVKLNEIKYKEMPVLDDEFAQEVSDYNTLSEYKDSVRRKLELYKMSQVEELKANYVLNALLKKVSITPPRHMVKSQLDYMIENFEKDLEERDITLENFLEHNKITYETFEESYKKAAENKVKIYFISMAIANAENIKVSDSDIAELVMNDAKILNMDPVDLFEKVMNDESQKTGYTHEVEKRKVIELILSKSVIMTPPIYDSEQ